MGFLAGLVTYVMIWWVVIFSVLPWGNRASMEQDGGQQVGNTASAPQNPNLKKKFLITTLISALVWVGIFILVEMDIIDFRLLSQDFENENL